MNKSDFAADLTTRIVLRATVSHTPRNLVAFANMLVIPRDLYPLAKHRTNLVATVPPFFGSIRQDTL